MAVEMAEAVKVEVETVVVAMVVEEMAEVVMGVDTAAGVTAVAAMAVEEMEGV